jgi:hypothetical protein
VSKTCVSVINIACELFNNKNDDYHKMPIIESAHKQNCLVKEYVSSDCFNFFTNNICESFHTY